jgi:hypothetical protein
MIHYSCDRCKRMLDPAQEMRYVVKIDVQAMLEPTEMDESDDDRDHLVEINDMLEDLDLDDLDLDGDEERQKQTFDLCPQCYRRFIQDPLGTESSFHVGFSHN